MTSLPAGGQRKIRLATRAGVLPPTRFIILTTGRAGSVLLVTLLDSTPDIRCRREVLGRSPFAHNPWRKLHRRAARDGLRSAAWGTSLIPEELCGERVGDPRQWIGRLHESGFQIITLVRDNPVRAGISGVLANARGRYHHREDTAPPVVRLDPLLVLSTVVQWEEKATLVRSLVGARSHLAITYEDGLQTPEAQQHTVTRVRGFLGMGPATATTPLVRLSTPLHEQIENFDEIVDVLGATHLREYLNGID